MHTYSSFQSTSKSCHTDPEDNKFMICKETIYDGKNKI